MLSADTFFMAKFWQLRFMLGAALTSRHGEKVRAAPDKLSWRKFN